jgi:acrylyl-CoA reductase (NADPH)/3-hydroxypropionyl-CoA dehydratase/3-hydroxypropionyl-CoA synthetase
MAGAFMDDLDDLGDSEEIQRFRSNALTSSTIYFESAAKKNLSWYHPGLNSWLRHDPDKDAWSGWSSDATERTSLPGEWTPWSSLLDSSEPPFYKWFSDGMTNAAYNEVDVHVLEGYGEDIAYIEEFDPNDGLESAITTRHELLAKSAAAARHLKTKYNLQKGDRVLINMPAGIEQILWVEACKRLGIIYCCCNPGLPPEQIADRVYVLRAKLVISVEHPDWSFVVHNALNNYIPVEEALQRSTKIDGFDTNKYASQWSSRFTVSVKEPPFSCGSQVCICGAEYATETAKFCYDCGRKLQQALPQEVTHIKEVLYGCKVLVIGTVQVPWNSAQKNLQAPEKKAETSVFSKYETLHSDCTGAAYVAELWKEYGPPVPVEANFPLFIIFTSGTTGKPKGVAHTHTYAVGLVETMRVVFDADPDYDRMLTVGALGWITGQSYQIAAPLASRVTAVIMLGNPVRPVRHRFAQVINKHDVTIFKAGSAFLREVMAVKEAMEAVKAEKTTEVLRVATFCAEPVSAAVQEFAMNAICKNYINSYWATEHGGIVWSRKFDDPTQPLEANAHSWPMTWVDADVWAFQGQMANGVWKARQAKVGERAEVVCTAPYPYMFRYVWGDLDNFGQPGWVGDRSIMLKKYWRRTRLTGNEEMWAYVQGDFAVKHDDGAFTFHGRSDEVLNVNGILFGTEHIEGAILRDKQLNPDSKVGHCVVTGYPDEVSGEVPLAWIVPGDPKQVPDADDFTRLWGLVRDTVGQLQVKFIICNALPQTFSGKFMRRLLSSISQDKPLGDVSTIANADCIPGLVDSYKMWKSQQDILGDKLFRKIRTIVSDIV